MRPRYITPSEGYVQKEVVKFAEARGWLGRKMKYEGRSGAPDFFFFGPGGKILIVEFKAPDEKPRIQQEREHKRLRALGFTIHVIDNVEAGKALFRFRGEALI